MVKPGVTPVKPEVVPKTPDGGEELENGQKLEGVIDRLDILTTLSIPAFDDAERRSE